MVRDFQRELRPFERVWRRVTDSRPGPPPPPPPPPRPQGLMPKRKRCGCAQRFCPRR